MVFDPINQATLITNIVIITSKKASLSNRNPNKNSLKPHFTPVLLSLLTQIEPRMDSVTLLIYNSLCSI